MDNSDLSDPSHPWWRPYVAKLTAVTDVGGEFLYDSVEMIAEAGSGDYVEADGPRATTDVGVVLRELNNLEIDVTGEPLVRAWFRGEVNGALQWVFDSSGLIGITVANEDSAPYPPYPTVDYDPHAITILRADYDGAGLFVDELAAGDYILSQRQAGYQNSAPYAGCVGTDHQAWQGVKWLQSSVLISLPERIRFLQSGASVDTDGVPDFSYDNYVETTYGAFGDHWIWTENDNGSDVPIMRLFPILGDPVWFIANDDDTKQAGATTDGIPFLSAGNGPSFFVYDSGYLEGLYATTGGLTFSGGLYTGGTLSMGSGTSIDGGTT